MIEVQQGLHKGLLSGPPGLGRLLLGTVSSHAFFTVSKPSVCSYPQRLLPRSLTQLKQETVSAAQPNGHDSFVHHSFYSALHIRT
jgi:hypothetical protein